MSGEGLPVIDTTRSTEKAVHVKSNNVDHTTEVLNSFDGQVVALSGVHYTFALLR
jgi:hypothetical protein